MTGHAAKQPGSHSKAHTQLASGVPACDFDVWCHNADKTAAEHCRGDNCKQSSRSITLLCINYHEQPLADRQPEQGRPQCKCANLWPSVMLKVIGVAACPQVLPKPDLLTLSSFLRPEGSNSSENSAAVCAISVMNLWSSSTAKRCKGGGVSPSKPQDPRADTLASSPVHHDVVMSLSRSSSLQ